MMQWATHLRRDDIIVIRLLTSWRMGSSESGSSSGRRRVEGGVAGAGGP